MASLPLLKIASFAVTSTDFTRIPLVSPFRGASLCLTLEQAPVGDVPTAAAGDMILGYREGDVGSWITQRRAPEVSLGVIESDGQSFDNGYVDVKATSSLDVLLKVSWV